MPDAGEPTDSSAVREEIARRIETHSLPVVGEQRIFGGYGSNEVCDCCDKPIRRTDVLYEVEVTQTPAPVVLAMHRWCFNIWMEESVSRQGQRGS